MNHGRRGVLVLCSATVVLAGGAWLVGGVSRVDHGPLARTAASVESALAEGSLLASVAADGRGTGRATSTHAAELAVDLDETASRLRGSRVAADDRTAAVDLADIAADAADDLLSLQSHPTDQSVARRVAGRLQASQHHLEPLVRGLQR